MSWIEEADMDTLKTLLVSQAGPAFNMGMTFDELGAELTLRGAKFEHGAGFADQPWDRVKQEFHSFVCVRGGKYADLQKKADALGSQGTTALVALVAGGLGAAVGAAATVIAPLVALLLLLVCRIGKEVFCTIKRLDVVV